MEATTVEGTMEFRARKRSYPRSLVNFLALITFGYGLVLMLTLPLSIQEVMFASDSSLMELGIFGRVWAGILVLIGTIIMARWVWVQGAAFLEHDRLRRSTPKVSDVELPFVSILVPAYNETDTIEGALASLVTLDYPRYEIIMVDDGSSDETYAKALPMAGQYENCTLRVFTKPNGGKWSALNFAYARAKGDLLLCVDADSGLARDSLRWLVPRLSEPGVVGVSGQVTIRNRVNHLTRFQATEYLLGNGGMRMALSKLGLVTVVPGPIGLYKRAIMERIASLRDTNPTDLSHHGEGAVEGPVSGETFAEDFQLSLTALALGGKIVYEQRALAYTKCPERIDVLLSQRYRWIRGTWQVYSVYVRKLRHLNNNKSWMLPIVMAILYPLDIFLIPLLNFMFWGSIAASAVAGLALDHVVVWIGSVCLLNMMTTMVYILEQDDEIVLLAYVPILDVYQSLLVNSAWVIAAIDELRGTRMKWH